MATSKPISTISYNTVDFLQEKLEEWHHAHIIQSYTYICHKGEDGDKDHIHLRIEPNKKLDPMNLTEQLKEYVYGEDKPRGVRPWRPSKEEDWILYAIHQERYLKLKYGGGEKGEKLPYKWEDIKHDDNLDMEISYIRAMQYLEHSQANIILKLQEGKSPSKLIEEGENVYIVNALVRTVKENIVPQLVDELNQTKAQLNDLIDAIMQ